MVNLNLTCLLCGIKNVNPDPEAWTTRLDPGWVGQLGLELRPTHLYNLSAQPAPPIDPELMSIFYMIISSPP